MDFSGQEPRMLNVLQCVGGHPTTNNCPPTLSMPMLINPETGGSWVLTKPNRSGGRDKRGKEGWSKNKKTRAEDLT